MSKVVKVQAPDGTVIKVEGPDDATDEQFIQQGALLYQQQKKPAQPSPAAAPREEDLRSPGQVMIDQMDAVASGVKNAPITVPKGLWEMLKMGLSGNAMGLAKGMAGGAKPLGTLARGAAALAAPNIADEGPTSVEWKQAGEAAGTNIAATLAAPLLEGGANVFSAAKARMLPTKAGAGAKFERVMSAARDVPIDLSATEPIIQRAQELAQRGSSAAPKVLRDFIKNRKSGNFMSQPVAAEPMSYEVGRDFASNAGRVSADEASRMADSMRAQVSKFAKAMKDANREAASSVGMEDLYDQAMKEYRQAKTIEEAGAVIKKFATKAAITAAGLGAGYSIFNELRGQ